MHFEDENMKGIAIFVMLMFSTIVSAADEDRWEGIVYYPAPKMEPVYARLDTWTGVVKACKMYLDHGPAQLLPCMSSNPLSNGSIPRFHFYSGELGAPDKAHVRSGSYAIVLDSTDGRSWLCSYPPAMTLLTERTGR
jgi:hypothetical protein